jgi:hypothetical protein
MLRPKGRLSPLRPQKSYRSLLPTLQNKNICGEAQKIAFAEALSDTYTLQQNDCMRYEPVGSQIIVQADSREVTYGQKVSVNGFQAFETLGVGHLILANGSFDDFIVDSDGSYSNGGSRFDYVETEEASASNGNHTGTILEVKFVRNGSQLTIYRNQGSARSCTLIAQ